MSQLENGIYFENSSIMIPWNRSLSDIKKIGDPQIINNGGRTTVIWEKQSLLNGLIGNWSSTFYPEDLIFKSINLRFTGDKRSSEVYFEFKKHLLNILDSPSEIKEDNMEKEIKWQFKKILIHLYLFENHSFNCTLTVAYIGG